MKHTDRKQHNSFWSVKQVHYIRVCVRDRDREREVLGERGEETETGGGGGGGVKVGRGKRRSVDTEKRHNILVTVGLGGDTISNTKAVCAYNELVKC